MGNSSKKTIEWELACHKCFIHYLLEIISNKDIILIKTIWFYGETTVSAEPHIFYYIKLKTNYYQLKDFDVIPNRTINKYCYQCNNFMSDQKILNHKHKTIINAADYIYNCKIYKSEIL